MDFFGKLRKPPEVPKKGPIYSDFISYKDDGTVRDTGRALIMEVKSDPKAESLLSDWGVELNLKGYITAPIIQEHELKKVVERMNLPFRLPDFVVSDTALGMTDEAKRSIKVELKDAGTVLVTLISEKLERIETYEITKYDDPEIKAVKIKYTPNKGSTAF